LADDLSPSQPLKQQDESHRKGIKEKLKNLFKSSKAAPPPLEVN